MLILLAKASPIWPRQEKDAGKNIIDFDETGGEEEGMPLEFDLQDDQQ